MIDLRVPELGENVKGGDVTRVLVSVGDTIAHDQPVVELETDKATIEVPSSVAGKVQEVRVRKGDKVIVGTVILTVEGAAANVTPSQASEGTHEAKVVPMTPRPAPEKVPAPRAHVVEGGLGPPASPMVRRLAREIGVDVDAVQGTGPHGRVTQADVKEHARRVMTSLGSPAPVPSVSGSRASRSLPDLERWGPVERQPWSNIRRATAEHLGFAWAVIPHVTQHTKADITAIDELRKKHREQVAKAGGSLTVTALLVHVVAAAVKQFPQFNASLDAERGEIVYKKYVNVGVAVDTDRGLLVPVIREADRKTITRLAVELYESAAKARDRKLTLDDMSGGGITISNLGGIGGTSFTPIVNWPEVAILGVSRGSVEAVWLGNAFEPRLMLPLSLSYDHRVIDGADAVRFLQWIVDALEKPLFLSLID